MSARPDGTRNARSAQSNRIDWGARRRAVNALLRNPPQRIWWGFDLDELIDQLCTALYIAESAAERVPNPELLRELLLAKGAAGELHKRFSQDLAL